jgi:hypothetical protein
MIEADFVQIDAFVGSSPVWSLCHLDRDVAQRENVLVVLTFPPRQPQTMAIQLLSN